MVAKSKASTAGQGDAKAIAAATAAVASANAVRTEEEQPVEADDVTLMLTIVHAAEGEYCLVGGKVVRKGHGSIWTGAERYEGEWLHDHMHGRGEYSFATGATYDGEFQNNQFHGVGSYRWADGAHYEGGWHFNRCVVDFVAHFVVEVLFVARDCGVVFFAVRMHGDGLYVDKDGVEWRGRFVNGKYDNGRIFHMLR
ncbi:MORN motif [Phytophthora cactorum]|nr:MORN motif [Phytophthora cactorum]